MILVTSKVITVTGSCPRPLQRCRAGESWGLYRKEKIKKLEQGHIQTDRRGGPATGPEEERREEKRAELKHSSGKHKR